MRSLIDLNILHACCFCVVSDLGWSVSLMCYKEHTLYFPVLAGSVCNALFLSTMHLAHHCTGKDNTAHTLCEMSQKYNIIVNKNYRMCWKDAPYVTSVWDLMCVIIFTMKLKAESSSSC